MHSYCLFVLRCLILITILINYVNIVDGKMTFNLGQRLEGDQLLIKDFLAISEEPLIKFTYHVKDTMNYIEISSESNEWNSIYLTNNMDTLNGEIKLLEDYKKHPNYTTDDSLKFLIEIYGINRTQQQQQQEQQEEQEEQQLNNDESYNLHQLNKRSLDDVDETEVEFINPSPDDYTETDNIINNHDNDEDGSVSDDDLDDLDDIDDDEDDDDTNYYDLDDDDNDNGGDGSDNDEHFEANMDKIIELGERQKGDYLLYESYQTSEKQTDQPQNHTITFYYVDSDFITYIKFLLFDHFYSRNPTANDYQPPLTEYTHISPNTLKAVITDPFTTNLFIQMQIYGYHRKDLPVDYKFYMPQRQMSNSGRQEQHELENTNRAAIEQTLSKLNRIKYLMNSQQHTDAEQVQQAQQLQESHERLQKTITQAEAELKCLTQSGNTAAGPLNTLHSLHLALLSICLKVILF